jgi:hypothetical protein
VKFYALFMCKCVLPPGVNPTAVDKYIYIYIYIYISITMVIVRRALRRISGPKIEEKIV